jgi:hypothetical protein
VRKVSEFKTELYNYLKIKHTDRFLTESDIEIIYNNELMDGEYDMEYLIT